MIRNLIIGFVLLFSEQSLCVSNLDSLVNSGLELSYNFEFEKSSETFNQIINQYPDNPEGYFYLSQNHLWFYLGTRDEGELKTFERFTELALEKCDALISREGESAYYIGLLGDLALQEAMVAASEEKTLSAFFSTKSAYGYFEDALEIDSTYYKAYLGLGLLEYALSYVPGMFKWAIDITGLGRDKDKGFEYVCLANENSENRIAKTESAFHKAKMLAEYIGDTKAAIDILESLVQAYPQNLLFRYQAALAYIDNRQLELAEENLNFVLSNPDSRFIQTIAFSNFLLGEINFRNNNFKTSITYFEKFLEMSRGFEYAGMAYYNMALAYWIIGNESEAKKNLLLARNGNSDISDDVYAARRSEILYQNLPDKDNIVLIEAGNDLHAGRYDSTLLKLEPIQNNFDGDNYIESRLIMSEAEISRGDYSEANKYLNDIDLSMPVSEEWFIPYYYYLLTKIELAQGNLEKAKISLDEALENNDYDFQEKIQAKLNYLKHKIYK